MNEEVILRSVVMRQVDMGDPFDMIFVTADRRRGTGGKLITVKQWQKMNSDAPVEILPGRYRQKARQMIKNPNHWENKTINIWNPSNRTNHPHKVHFRLIQFFNNKRVVNG